MTIPNEKAIEAIMAFPKADLHIHFEGCVTPKILTELSAKHKVPLHSPLHFGQRHIKIPDDFDFAATDFADFRNFAVRYLRTTELIRTAEDIIAIGSAHLEITRTHNITAAQYYFTPSSFKLMSIDVHPLFAGLLEFETLARRNYDCQVSWIFDIARNSPQPPAETLELALSAKKMGLTVNALGLAGDENRNHPHFYAPIFAQARAHGLQLLAHAGEGTTASSILETVSALNPSRIGHGISAVQDPTCIARLKDLSITLEVCPWSNICMGKTTKDNHPIRQMLEQGLDIIIASDDPGIFGKSLVDNYIFAHEAGVPLEELARLARRSVELAEAA